VPGIKYGWFLRNCTEKQLTVVKIVRVWLRPALANNSTLIILHFDLVKHFTEGSITTDNWPLVMYTTDEI
jgi:hypothetical protein